MVSQQRAGAHAQAGIIMQLEMPAEAHYSEVILYDAIQTGFLAFNNIDNTSLLNLRDEPYRWNRHLITLKPQLSNL